MTEAGNSGIAAIQSIQKRWNHKLRHHVTLGVLIGIVLMIVGGLASLRVDHGLIEADYEHLRARLQYLRLAHAAVAMIMFIGILRWRETVTLNLVRRLFFVLGTLLACVVWYAQSIYVLSSQPFLPFSYVKTSFIFLAAVNLGGVRYNLLMMLPSVIEAVLAWHYFGFASRGQMAQVGEPVLTIFFGIVSVIILFMQHQYQKANHDQFTAEIRAAANEWIARVFLSVRDRANTPLQTLELNLEMMQKPELRMDEVVERSHGALQSLKSLFRIFSEYEAQVNGDDRGLLSDKHWKA